MFVEQMSPQHELAANQSIICQKNYTKDAGVQISGVVTSYLQ